MTNLGTHVIFSEDAIDNLFHLLSTSESSDDFFAEVDHMATNREYTKELNGSIEFPMELEVDNDANSAITILSGVGYLDPANAADRRLWSYLALVTFREYLLERWPLENKADWREVVKERMLLSSASRRPQIRNGISRLWWVASKTHDPQLLRKASKETGDEYCYTRWVLALQTRVQDIFERKAGSDPRVLWAILEAAYDSPASAQATEIKKYMKEVFRLTGFRQLDLLDEKELAETLKLDIAQSTQVQV